MHLRRRGSTRYFLELCPPGVPLRTFAFDVMHYVFAQRFVRGRVVLDAATGKGYGAYHLASVGAAKMVVGIDLDEAALTYGRAKHRLPNVSFERMDVTCTAFRRASFDVVVSFETLEHIPPNKAPRFMEEMVRVLKPNGLFVLSTPNRPVYSAITRTAGHVNEMDFEGLNGLLSQYFRDRSFYCQGTNWSERVRAERPCGMAQVARGLVRRHLSWLATLLLECPIRMWAERRRLPRSLTERRVGPALCVRDLRSSLIQVAVCRRPQWSTVVTRTQRGKELFLGALKEGYINANPLTVDGFMAGVQSPFFQKELRGGCINTRLVRVRGRWIENLLLPLLRFLATQVYRYTKRVR